MYRQFSLKIYHSLCIQSNILLNSDNISYIVISVRRPPARERIKRKIKGLCKALPSGDLNLKI